MILCCDCLCLCSLSLLDKALSGNSATDSIIKFLVDCGIFAVVRSYLHDAVCVLKTNRYVTMSDTHACVEISPK